MRQTITVPDPIRDAIQEYLRTGEGYAEKTAAIVRLLSDGVRERFELVRTPELLNTLHVLRVALGQLEAGGNQTAETRTQDELPHVGDLEEIAAECRLNPADAEPLLKRHFGPAIATMLQRLTGVEPPEELIRSVVAEVNNAIAQGRSGGILALIRNEVVESVLRSDPTAKLRLGEEVGAAALLPAAAAIERALEDLSAAERAALVAFYAYDASETAIALQTKLPVEAQRSLRRRFRRACLDKESSTS